MYQQLVEYDGPDVNTKKSSQVVAEYRQRVLVGLGRTAGESTAACQTRGKERRRTLSGVNLVEWQLY